MSHTICFSVAQYHTQQVKHALDKLGLLDHARTIQVKDASCHIPTTLSVPESEGDQPFAQKLQENLIRDLRLSETSDEISWFIGTTRRKRSLQSLTQAKPALMASAVNAWVQTLPLQLLKMLDLSPKDILQTPLEIYALYPPILILSKRALSVDPWKRLLQDLDSHIMQDLYQKISSTFRVTHLAISGGIPSSVHRDGSASTVPNILRSPQFQPLLGNFGELLPGPPTVADLARAFWVTTKQNGIFQCWAPLYTMFSQGNVKEKERLLSFLQLNSHEILPSESTAVDLYAGIGYFAFSYAKAGFKKVLCWELNPWSVEGLRRGAVKNRWKVALARDNFQLDDSQGMNVKGDENIIAFEEDNIYAAKRISAMREELPPVRHVNCGLLPSSRAVWQTALDILDPGLGGWVHVHENIANHEKESRSEQILMRLRRYAAPRRLESWELRSVKSYAPGVTHCVIDVQISPIPSSHMHIVDSLISENKSTWID